MLNTNGHLQNCFRTVLQLEVKLCWSRTKIFVVT